jgi:hypothetical protein
LLSLPGAAGHVLKNDQLKYFYDAWGSDKTYNHMAVGWTWAFDTPFKWTKQVASHFGGPRQGRNHGLANGWNELREQIFANQKKLGVIPSHATLTPWPSRNGRR